MGLRRELSRLLLASIVGSTLLVAQQRPPDVPYVPTPRKLSRRCFGWLRWGKTMWFTT